MNKPSQTDTIFRDEYASSLLFRMTREEEERVLESIKSRQRKPVSTTKKFSYRRLMDLGAVVAAFAILIGILAAISPSSIRRITASINGPRVVVFTPFVGNARPTSPAVTAYVEQPANSDSSTGKPFTAKQLTVDVSLNANMQTTTFSPVTLYVTGQNGVAYSKSYPVTLKSLRVKQQDVRQYKIKVAVPPQSGEYTVAASSSQFRGDPNAICVDYGGYYRTGSLSTNVINKSGNIELTVNKIIMTPDATRILFHVDTNQLKTDITPSRTAEEFYRDGTAEKLTTVGVRTNPIAGWISGELDLYPVKANTEKLEFTILVSTSPGTKVQPFTFNIPLNR